MAGKSGRDKIKLESTAGTGHFYTTSKSKNKQQVKGDKKNASNKLELMKFDPKARKHVLYKEVKLK